MLIGKTAKRVMTIISFVLLAVLTFQIIEFATYRAQQSRQIDERAQSTMDVFRDELGGLLARVEGQGRELGAEFVANDYTDERIRTRIREVSLEQREIRGVTACFEPFAFSPGTRLYCPYFNKSTGDYLDVADSYDYTERGPGTAWYGGVVDNGAGWSEPYYGEGAQEWFVDYGVPFTFADGPRAGEVQGVVDFSLEVGDFQKLVQNLIVGRASYSFITSPEGLFVSHPDADAVGTRTLDDAIADAELDPVMRDVFRAVRNGETGRLSYRDTTIDDRAIVLYDRIEGANFGIVTVYYERDLDGSQSDTNRRYIAISLTLTLFLIVGAIRFFARDDLEREEIEGLSFATSTILLLNLLFIGLLVHTLDIEHLPSESPPIVEMSALGGLIAEEDARADTLRIDPPTVVPTAFYIEELEYADSYNLNLGGVLWQKYPLDRPDDLEIGVRFPQMSPFAEAALIEETYREEIEAKVGEEGYLLVGYEIRVTLRLSFSYRDYPFDKRHIDIRVAPASRTGNVMLVPDLDSYANTNPASQPGIDPDISMPGNRIVESYYNFTFGEFGTDFGYDGAGSTRHVPQLHFNIHQKRYLINAFVTYLIPVFVTLALIYILILTVEKTGARQGVIESMAAFFFVLIFSHIDLRKDVVTADLMFMEFFYFITYGMIILSTFNLISFARGRVSYFDYNDNQIFRAFYFPIFFVLVLVVMLWRFY